MRTDCRRSLSLGERAGVRGYRFRCDSRTRKKPKALPYERRSALMAPFALPAVQRQACLPAGRFRRQHPFGPYELDFYSHAVRLVVEVDGSQHDTSKGKAGDEERRRFLEAAGFHVLRFTNREVLLETEPVLGAIWEATKGYDPSPSPSGRGDLLRTYSGR
jgi:very-short-patch-repair endonuclease